MRGGGGWYGGPYYVLEVEMGKGLEGGVSGERRDRTDRRMRFRER